MDEQREEREELEALERDVEELRREQEAEDRFYSVADILAEQGAPGWRDGLNREGTTAWTDAVKRPESERES